MTAVLLTSLEGGSLKPRFFYWVILTFRLLMSYIYIWSTHS